MSPPDFLIEIDRPGQIFERFRVHVIKKRNVKPEYFKVVPKRHPALAIKQVNVGLKVKDEDVIQFLKSYYGTDILIRTV